MMMAKQLLQAAHQFPVVLPSYVMGEWQECKDGTVIYDATYGQPLVKVSSEGLDIAASLNYARTTGRPSLQTLSFHDRALRLKAIAQHLLSKKDLFYELSYKSGATKKDSFIDIDGGIGTLFSYSSLVRREFPNETFLIEDKALPLSRDDSFFGQHLLISKEGAAVHINAYNFPCWGMLEKFAPTFLGGMPSVIKPAPQTAYITQAVVEEMLETGLLPEGSLQLICGEAVDFFEHLKEQDVVTFTGSAETGKALKAHQTIIDKAVPFNLEADSLNAAVLGLSAQADSPEFELFVKELVSEMTLKTGQRCTAIRRALVPKHLVGAVQEAVAERLSTFKLGDPSQEAVTLGPLVDALQKQEVARRLGQLQASSELIYRAPLELVSGDAEKGGFLSPALLYCNRPLSPEVHEVEAFGPVSTLLPYETLDDAVELAKLGKGSLVLSIMSRDAAELKELVLGAAPYHGRIHVLNRDNAKSSTGHGSPLPTLVHGGPGRAGGGEELGGARAIKHYMQRTALQADPSSLMAISKQYVQGAKTYSDRVHPFKKTFDELSIGESYLTHRRTVTEADIVNFANISGDYFYAHVDAVAAPESIFEKRVAHGYFLVSAAAGLFVDPAPGPVLANYGLENLRFIEPVGIGDTIRAALTVKQKIKKEKREDDKYATGVVEWDVRILNQDEVAVALYSILTLVRRAEDDIQT